MVWGNLYWLVVFTWTPCPEDSYRFPDAPACRRALGWLNEQERIWKEESQQNPLLWDRYQASRYEFHERRVIWDTLLGAQATREYPIPDPTRQRLYLAWLRCLLGDAAYYNGAMPFPLLRVK